MRLLNARTKRFQEFFDDKIPSYLILSHRWEGEEVSFQEFQQGEKKTSISYAKIMNFCRIAMGKAVEWVWIDTCCIDKSSSAELTEAINSMCLWYARASFCYAYLSDVKGRLSDNRSQAITEAGPRLRNQFRESLWFTRGWTLQELLAPRNVQFFDRDWKYLGDKFKLWREISVATGIEEEYMRFEEVKHASIAKKMSWAANRKTSRIEDMAYCLLGIFDVSMPLLYGEGNKAFQRLQLEVMRVSNDQSIFAWEMPKQWDFSKQSYPHSGMLAPTPEWFRESSNINLPPPGAREIGTMPYAMTNKGLQLQIPERQLSQQKYSETCPMAFELNCYRGRNTNMLSISIFPPKSSLVLPDSVNVWYRDVEQPPKVADSSGLVHAHPGAKFVTIYIQKPLSPMSWVEGFEARWVG